MNLNDEAIDSLSQLNEIDFKVYEAEKANGIRSTSQWFKTN